MLVKLTVWASSRCIQTEYGPRDSPWLACQDRRAAAFRGSAPRALNCDRRWLHTSSGRYDEEVRGIDESPFRIYVGATPSHSTRAARPWRFRTAIVKGAKSRRWLCRTLEHAASAESCLM